MVLKSYSTLNRAAVRKVHTSEEIYDECAQGNRWPDAIAKDQHGGQRYSCRRPQGGNISACKRDSQPDFASQ
jgi:hypothetical protein